MNLAIAEPPRGTHGTPRWWFVVLRQSCGNKHTQIHTHHWLLLPIKPEWMDGGEKKKVFYLFTICTHSPFETFVMQIHPQESQLCLPGHWWRVWVYAEQIFV